MTISDFVADLRAPTPSAAAELAVYDFEQLMDKLAVYQSTLTHALQVQIDRQQNCLNQFRLKLRFLSPINQIQQKRTYCMDLEEKLTGLMENVLMQQKHRMALYAEQLKGLSPLDKLSQGYAYVEDMQHKVVNDMRRMKIGDSVCIYVRNGMIQAEITKTQEGCLEKEVEDGKGANVGTDI